MVGVKWEDRYIQFGSLPEHTLFELARNEAAPRNYRKLAVEILILNGFEKASHPEVSELKREVLMEQVADPIPEPVLHETELLPVTTQPVRPVEKAVEKAVEKPNPKPEESGPFKASVTTATM